MSSTSDIASRIIDQADGPSQPDVDRSSTSTAARNAIKTVESRAAERPSTPSTSNAHEYPEFVQQEFQHYAGRNPSPTRRAAAAMVATMDERPLVRTKHNQVRRAFDPDGNPVRQFVREQIDKQTAAGAIERRLRDAVKANPKMFPGLSPTDPIQKIAKAVFDRDAK